MSLARADPRPVLSSNGRRMQLCTQNSTTHSSLCIEDCSYLSLVDVEGANEWPLTELWEIFICRANIDYRANRRPQLLMWKTCTIVLRISSLFLGVSLSICPIFVIKVIIIPSIIDLPNFESCLIRIIVNESVKSGLVFRDGRL